MRSIPSPLQHPGAASDEVVSGTTVNQPPVVMDLPTPPDPPPDRPPHPPGPPDRDPDRDDDEAPETPPTEPEPVPIKEPPDAPGKRGPYVVE